ncbi:MAG: 16S rRNA (adenine(1518)-N(6)/adenine(1519)-N(6))-dimethyltransferase RsmA, partial [Bacteroidota bacterium]|nr:16S rRNA (adenine(1518)-N(6)/adenine(1519)-N(6))-dimethyltransferase RsmA [Bacteroidota bacterium]
LTQYLLQTKHTIHAIEVDNESVNYLNTNFPKLEPNLVFGDFLKCDLAKEFPSPLAIIGNFPYNISSQILFKTIENRNQIPEFVGMFQKEVAKRICEAPGSKAYGILSVLTQSFYDTEYLFNVNRFVFDPPPKVASAVLRLRRKETTYLNCDERLYFRVVKTAFQQRRKTLRNSLKTFSLPTNLKEDTIFGQRPEQLGVSDFVRITNLIAHDAI